MGIYNYIIIIFILPRVLVGKPEGNGTLGRPERR
jgi:hypothetical protein